MKKPAARKSLTRPVTPARVLGRDELEAVAGGANNPLYKADHAMNNPLFSNG